MGYSKENAIIFGCRDVVNDELQFPREEMSPAELHTLIANTRQDISAITILLSKVSAQQRQFRWLLSACLLILSIIAIRV
jgi:hypothetical protein